MEANLQILPREFFALLDNGGGLEQCSCKLDNVAGILNPKYNATHM